MNTPAKPAHPGKTCWTRRLCMATAQILMVPLAAHMQMSSTCAGGVGKLGLGRCRTSVAW
jgi:hypothetical protein